MSEGIDAITAAALGALQGLTEFLPVSSSGHIAVGAAFFGVQENPLALTVLLHLGTLLATILFLKDDLGLLLTELMESIRSPSRFRSTASGRMLTAIAIATLITAVLGVVLRNTAEEFTEDLRLVGLGFLISAAFLLASGVVSGKRDEVALWMATVVGLAQGLTVLPGISRSGVTIAAAMLLGIRGPEAFRFSFLISIPAIIGAASFEAGASQELGSLGGPAWIGGAVALVTGYVALVILRRVIFVGRMWMFAFYLVPLGVFLLTR